MLYRPAESPQDEALFAMMGAHPDQFERLKASSAPAPMGVYPDNWRTVQCFIRLRTQWRTGLNGPTGLDYAVLPVVMKQHGIPASARGKVFRGLQIMEDEALAVLHEKQE